MGAPLRIVFLGSDPIALPLLGWLGNSAVSGAQVVAVFTQPDRPAGRGQKVAPNEIKQWAERQGIVVHQPAKLTEEARSVLAACQADLSLVMAYGHILKDAFIETPRLGTLNLHTSILPKYRGASPIQSAIAQGDVETGVTLMRIVRELDAGPVADVERVSIAPRDTALEVEQELADACIPLLARALPRLIEGRLSFTEQDPASVSYCRKLTKEDGGVDFHLPAAAIAARINGLYPWPSCRVEITGQMVKLGGADTMPGTARAGEVVGADGEGLLVGTAQGLVRLLRLQRPGGRMLSASEFLRGLPILAGTKLPSSAMPALVGREPFR